MARIKIIKTNEAGYYEKYQVEIATSKQLTSEEYKTITDAVEEIAGVLDEYINQIRAEMPEKEDD